MGAAKGAELQKRTTIRLRTTSISGMQVEREKNLSKQESKNSSTYGKEKDMHTSTVQVTASILYAEDKFDITKKSSKP
jgi:hypothetical protein